MGWLPSCHSNPTITLHTAPTACSADHSSPMLLPMGILRPPLEDTFDDSSPSTSFHSQHLSSPSSLLNQIILPTCLLFLPPQLCSFHLRPIKKSTMSYSDFKHRLHANLAANNLTINDVFHLPPFGQLESQKQRAVTQSCHEAREPTCQHNNRCVEMRLAEAVKRGWTPAHMVYSMADAVAKQVEGVANKAETHRAASVAKVAELAAKVEELEAASVDTVHPKEGIIGSAAGIQQSVVEGTVPRDAEWCERHPTFAAEVARTARAMAANEAEETQAAQAMAVNEAVALEVKKTEEELLMQFNMGFNPDARASVAVAAFEELAATKAALEGMEVALAQAAEQASRDKRAALRQAAEEAETDKARAVANAIDAAEADKEEAIKKAVERAQRKSSACAICYDKEPNHMPFTCQHVAVCEGELTATSGADEDCLYRLESNRTPCPICRCEVQRRYVCAGLIRLGDVLKAKPRTVACLHLWSRRWCGKKEKRCLSDAVASSDKHGKGDKAATRGRTGPVALRLPTR